MPAATEAAPSPGAAATTPPRVPRPTLQGLVEWETARGVERSNTRAYVSGARSALRMMWFLDFISALINGLLDNPTAELAECTRKAYTAALEHRHTWIVRTAIGSAMYFLPTRTAFLASLGSGRPTEELEPSLREFVVLVERVRKELWAYYAAHGITDLP